jgi:hypothetical protein
MTLSMRTRKYKPRRLAELDVTTETQGWLESPPAEATAHFQVTAYNAAGESAKSTEASVTLN